VSPVTDSVDTTSSRRAVAIQIASSATDVSGLWALDSGIPVAVTHKVGGRVTRVWLNRGECCVKDSDYSRMVADVYMTPRS
jgi:hypothetical protein